MLIVASMTVDYKLLQKNVDAKKRKKRHEIGKESTSVALVEYGLSLDLL